MDSSHQICIHFGFVANFSFRYLSPSHVTLKSKAIIVILQTISLILHQTFCKQEMICLHEPQKDMST